jgi:hypothetical protein
VCGCVTHYRRVNTKRDGKIAVNARMMEPDEIGSIKVNSIDVRKPGRRRTSKRS